MRDNLICAQGQFTQGQKKKKEKCDHMSIDDYAIVLPCMVFCKHKTNEEKQRGLGLHTGLEMEKTPSYGWITGIR